MGFRILHYVRSPEGALVEHEGDVDKCLDPECEWPRIESMVTASIGHLERTGSLISKSDGRMVVRVSSGTEYEADAVRRPDWGIYCPHGVQISEAVPAEHTCGNPDRRSDGFLPGYGMLNPVTCSGCFPEGRYVEPWPCAFMECSRASFEKSMREEEEAYYEEMRQSYYG